MRTSAGARSCMRGFWTGWRRRWPAFTGACWTASAMRSRAPRRSSAMRLPAISRRMCMTAARSSWFWTACFRMSTATIRRQLCPQSADIRHTPGSAVGCTIFVKLWQFDPVDRTQVRIATAGQVFVPVADRPLVSILPLFQDSVEQVRLEQWAPGARVDISAPGGLELLVLTGSFTDQDEQFTEQSWLRLPPGAAFAGVAGPVGCRAWVKSGHLTAF